VAHLLELHSCLRPESVTAFESRTKRVKEDCDRYVYNAMEGARKAGAGATTSSRGRQTSSAITTRGEEEEKAEDSAASSLSELVSGGEHLCRLRCRKAGGACI
jgi:hypothetical protein